MEHWEREKKLLSNIERGRNVFEKDIFSEFELSAKLNFEQTEAVKQLLKSPDQFYALTFRISLQLMLKIGTSYR